jgi:hypothetical protein
MPTELPANRKRVLEYFHSLPADIQGYFEDLENVLVCSPRLPLEVAVAYLFYRVERAQRYTLYCGVVRLHDADSDLAWKIVNRERLSRQSFREQFKNILGKALPPKTEEKYQGAVHIRNKAIHGRGPDEAEMRRAIVDLLQYAAAYNVFVYNEAGFTPFGDLRGFHGRGIRLKSSTTRWLLKGLGFDLK